MLSSYRVIDLTDDRGQLGGFLLAQLGAEVIAVEPPAGHRFRHVGSFAGSSGPDASLHAMAYNRGKASVVCDDPAAIARLAADADIVIDCGAFDLDLAALAAEHPHLVIASISPYGSTGPKAAWRGTDLTASAASGTMSVTGDPDRAPVRVSSPMTWHYAALDATCGALLALWERHRSGLGQHVDISAAHSYLSASQFQMTAALVGVEPSKRRPGGVALGPFNIQFVYPCRDGQVTVTFLFGAMMGPFTARLFRWICQEGMCDESLRDKNWIDFAMDVFEGREPPSELDRATAVLSNFLATKTKAELLVAALGQNLLIAPVANTSDVLALEQLAARDFWETDDDVRHPGALAKFSKTPLPVLPAAAPLGTDTDRILNTPRARPTSSVPPRTDLPPKGLPPKGLPPKALPLEGVKVLDFMWAMAGPAATRLMADYGATVVKIETAARPDVLRGVHPFIGQEGGQENALQFHSLNAGKLDLTMNLGLTEAREVVLDLVRWADVVTESFSPKAMAAWGLSYADLVAVNPNLIMLSSCLMGQTGPMRLYAGFGTMAAAIAGFYPLAGWPDRSPAGPFTAFTDYISPRFTVVAIMAALEHRRATGEGQYIDFSQLEGALSLLTPEFLDDQINDNVATRVGNSDPNMAPHGVYPAAGEDRWVAIACETDAEWSALAELVGRADLGPLSQAERLAGRDELDELVATWTATRDNGAIEVELQAVGVAAHRMAEATAVVVDPQLAHRGAFLQVPHPIHGTSWVEGSHFVLSRTPAHTAWAGPTFGQHIHEVLNGILGYDDERIAELIIAGALE